MKNPYLIGKRLYLRPVEREDAPVLIAWINDPDVARTLLGRGPINLRAEEAFIERVSQSENQVVLVIALRDSDKAIGATGLHDIDFRNRHAGFGMLIGDKQEWGKGYATESTCLIVEHAFMTLNLNRVWLHVYDRNAAALRAYEKVGFRREGVLRQHDYREGRYWDTITMAILREEWDALRRE